MRYMASMLRGCWIVGYDWVEASLAKGAWAPEAPYELKGDRLWTTASDAPTRARLFANARKESIRNGKRRLEQRVFEGQRFFFGHLKEEIDSGKSKQINTRQKMQHMEDLVRLGGGTVLYSSKAVKNTSNLSIVGISSKMLLPVQEARSLSLLHGCPFVSFLWLCDSISNFSCIPFRGYGSDLPGEPLSDIDKNVTAPGNLYGQEKWDSKRLRLPQSSPH